MNMDVQYQTIDECITDAGEKEKISRFTKAIVKAKKKGKTSVDSKRCLADALDAGRKRYLPKLKNNLKSKASDLKYKQRQVDDLVKNVEQMTKTIKDYEKQLKDMEEFDVEEIIDGIKALVFVDSVEVDFYGRLLVNTKPLTIIYRKLNQYDDYMDGRQIVDAGKYQIRIDFSYDNYSQAIKAVNLDWFSRTGNPHPCISGTEFCWGDIGNDVFQGYDMFDVVETVRLLIEFLRSGNDRAGHTRWARWVNKVVPAPEGWSIDLRDRGITYDDRKKEFKDQLGRKLKITNPKLKLNIRDYTKEEHIRS
jgi:hypothetical protein